MISWRKALDVRQKARTNTAKFTETDLTSFRCFK